MKKIIALLLISLLISIAPVFAKDGAKKFGSDLTIQDKTQISNILEKPDDFVGKRVLVTGLVTDVCATRGCWLELSSDKEQQTIRVKVNDGEIVFPMEAKGHNAVVEGEVVRLEYDKDGNLLSQTADIKYCADHGKKDEAKDDKCKHEDVKSDAVKKAGCSAEKSGNAQGCCPKNKTAKVEPAKVIYQIKGLGAEVEM